MKQFLLIFSVLLPTLGHAQPYSIDWFKIAGGGGTSSNGQFSVSGTVGQPDASGPMTGGSYSLTGGFWALYAVQTPGLPKLIILNDGADSVKILWPATGSYTLQQNSNLAGGSWATAGYTITNGFGTNFVTVTPAVGTWFFRLTQ